MLIDRLLERAFAIAPSTIDAVWEPGLVLAPVAGKVRSLSSVSDPVFSSGIMGPGLAFEPVSNVAYAPFDGVITAALESGHAYGIADDDGLEVLIHVGFDTVYLHGEGFTSHVSKNDRVRAGQPLVTFDRDLMRASGYSDTVVMTLTNVDVLSSYELLVGEGYEVRAGEPVAKLTESVGC